MHLCRSTLSFFRIKVKKRKRCVDFALGIWLKRRSIQEDVLYPWFWCITWFCPVWGWKHLEGCSHRITFDLILCSSRGPSCCDIEIREGRNVILLWMPFFIAFQCTNTHQIFQWICYWLESLLQSSCLKVDFSWSDVIEIALEVYGGVLVGSTKLFQLHYDVRQPLGCAQVNLF